MVEIGFKRLTKAATLPTKAHESDSGWDLYAAEDVIIAPGETVVVKTNIAVVLPDGYEAQVRPRSGITSKTKLRVQLGTIDNLYRGDIGIIIDHIGNYQPGVVTESLQTINNDIIHTCDLFVENSYIISKGSKIAQLVVQALPATTAYEVTELEETERNSNGFGSSGV